MSHRKKTHKKLVCVINRFLAFDPTRVDCISPPKC